MIAAIQVRNKVPVEYAVIPCIVVRIYQTGFNPGFKPHVFFNGMQVVNPCTVNIDILRQISGKAVSIPVWIPKRIGIRVHHKKIIVCIEFHIVHIRSDLPAFFIQYITEVEVGADIACIRSCCHHCPGNAFQFFGRVRDIGDAGIVRLDGPGIQIDYCSQGGFAGSEKIKSKFGIISMPYPDPRGILVEDFFN